MCPAPVIPALCALLAFQTAPDDRSKPAAEPPPKVRLNTVGYLPAADKRATVTDPAASFAVRRWPGGESVFEGRLSGPVPNADTREPLYTADFSAVREPGVYVVDAPSVGRSAPFRVAGDVYGPVFVTATRAMYLWRCGTAASGTHDGQTFSQAACHLDDAWLDVATGKHERHPSVGGWHDAGDYNKYVVNAGVTVGVMLRAWEDFPGRLRGVKLGTPESGGPLPDYLAEVRWELEWVLTMQAPDGSAYHKLSTKNFGGFVLPDQEKTPRFLSPTGTAATASLVAMTAAAARVYRPFDPPFADRCLAAAKRGAAYLAAHPKEIRPDLRAFRTGGYESRDADDRLWGAAELWESTGDPAALADLEARIRALKATFDRDFDWGEVKNLGLITYLDSRREGRDRSLVDALKTSLLATADGIVKTAREHGYARPLGSSYYWGANGSVARQAVVLHAADRLSPNPAYQATILDALNHLLGRNVDGRSYVTGVGHRPPLRPHDRRSGADKVDAPWPGYLVGGPHPRPTDWNDDQDDYRTNEIAINWNAALIYALASTLPNP